MQDTTPKEPPALEGIQEGQDLQDLQDREIRLRIWPAILIVLAHLGGTFGIVLFGSTNVQSFIGLVLVPVVGAALLGLWWLVASRAPILDRLAGLGLIAAALLVVVKMQISNGWFILAYAMPAMTTGLVALLAVTGRFRWPVRRGMAAALILACAAVFSAMRVDTIGGNLAPIVSWRWSPTEEERSQALAHPEVHGKADLPAHAGPGDWPAFLGPDRDGRLSGISFSSDWSVPPREVWRRKVGPGWSSFVAVGDYLFTQEQHGGEELVTCYRAATGEDVWINRVEAKYDDTMGLGPRATPVFFEGNLYTQGATGCLQCLDASTGAVVWKRNVAEDAGTKVPGYGFSSSPLVMADRVVEFTCGGEGKSVIGYRRATGEVAWLAGHGSSGYSSPQFAQVAGIPQILMANDFGMQAFNPETGAALWENAWKVRDNPRCVQPLVIGEDRVLYGATGRMGSRLLRIESKGGACEAKEEWTSMKYRPYFNNGVLHKGYCYGYDGDRLACIDLGNGERRWDSKRYGGQLLLIADMDLLLVLSEKGEVALVQAVPDSFKEMARFKAIQGKTWNHPAVAHGKLFVRNAEEAACFELPGFKAAS